MKKRILPFRFQPKSVKRSSVIIAGCGVALSVVLFSQAVLTHRGEPQMQASSLSDAASSKAVVPRNTADETSIVESSTTPNDDSVSPNQAGLFVDSRLKRLPVIESQTAENREIQHPAAEFGVGMIEVTSFNEEGEPVQAASQDGHQRLPTRITQLAKPLPYREREGHPADVGTPDSLIRSSRRRYAKNFGEKHLRDAQPDNPTATESPAFEEPIENSRSRLSLYPLKFNPVREFLKLVTRPNGETQDTGDENSQARRFPTIERRDQEDVANHAPNHASNGPTNHPPTGPAADAPGTNIAVRPTDPRAPAVDIASEPHDENRVDQGRPGIQPNTEAVIDVGPPLMPIVQQAPPTDPIANRLIADAYQDVITRHLTPPHLDPTLQSPIFELPNESYHSVLARPQPFAKPADAVPHSVAYQFPSTRREIRTPVSVLKSVTKIATQPTPVRADYGPSYASEFHRINEAAVAEHEAAMAAAERHHGPPATRHTQPSDSVLVKRGRMHQEPSHEAHAHDGHARQERLPRHSDSRLAVRPKTDYSADNAESRSAAPPENSSAHEKLAMSQTSSDPPPILPGTGNPADTAAPIDNSTSDAEEIRSGPGERVPEIIRPMHTIDSIQLANLGTAEQKIYEKYDFAKDKFGQADEQIDARGRFDVTQTNYVLYGKSAQFCYHPLRFEQYYLERYGRRVPYVQPLISGAHFYTSIALWPASVVIHPPWQRECTNPDFPPPGSDASVELNQPPMAY